MQSKSLDVIVRGLSLACTILKNDQNSCVSFTQANGVPTLLKLLSSADETLRVESTRILSYLAKDKLIDSRIQNENLLMRFIVLIEEGLQQNTDYSNEQV